MPVLAREETALERVLALEEETEAENTGSTQEKQPGIRILLIEGAGAWFSLLTQVELLQTSKPPSINICKCSAFFPKFLPFPSTVTIYSQFLKMQDYSQLLDVN